MRIIALLTALMLVGCLREPPKVEKVEPLPQPRQTQPVAPVVPEKPPVPPSYDFLRGYWDGYSGHWLGPVSWVFDGEYRTGHHLGSKDRKNGLPPQYPPG